MDDSFEFSLTQYLDGSLPDDGRAAIEERLRADPMARAMLEEHRKLANALRASAMPQVHWDRLAECISGAVEDEAQRQRYSISRYRGPMRWAMAASVLLAIGIISLWSRGPQVPAPVQTASVLDVTGPQAEVATGEPQADVSVGQPQEADAASAYTTDSIVVQRPTIALDGFPSVGHLQ
ncbi:MAG: hypothetical protein ABSH22_02835 [Tepidisphaeraceae bacterium]|jgi:anti-sigma factor RsiW